MIDAHARYRQRWYAGSTSGIRKQDSRLAIPDDIVRVEESSPCFKCGAARACEHRPWMLRR